jgi:hypothetical protein
MAAPIYQICSHPIIKEHIQPDRLSITVCQVRKWDDTDPIGSGDKVVKRLTSQAHAHQSDTIEIFEYHQVELSWQVKDVGLRKLGYLRSLDAPLGCTLCPARGGSHGLERCFPDETMIGTNLDLTVKAVNVTDVEKVEDRRDIKF